MPTGIIAASDLLMLICIHEHGSVPAMTTPDVEVEVTVPTDAPPPQPPADNTVVVATTPPPTSGVDGDVAAILVQHGERLTALEATVSTLAGATMQAQATAEVALDEAERVAEETEEAVATLAEEAGEATAEVQAEVEDIAPARDHPWYARRSFLRRGGGEE